MADSTDGNVQGGAGDGYMWCRTLSTIQDSAQYDSFVYFELWDSNEVSVVPDAFVVESAKSTYALASLLSTSLLILGLWDIMLPR